MLLALASKCTKYMPSRTVFTPPSSANAPVVASARAAPIARVTIFFCMIVPRRLRNLRKEAAGRHQTERCLGGVEGGDRGGTVCGDELRLGLLECDLQWSEWAAGLRRPVEVEHAHEATCHERRPQCSHDLRILEKNRRILIPAAHQHRLLRRPAARAHVVHRQIL